MFNIECMKKFSYLCMFYAHLYYTQYIGYMGCWVWGVNLCLFVSNSTRSGQG